MDLVHEPAGSGQSATAGSGQDLLVSFRASAMAWRASLALAPVAGSLEINRLVTEQLVVVTSSPASTQCR